MSNILHKRLPLFFGIIKFKGALLLPLFLFVVIPAHVNAARVLVVYDSHDLENDDQAKRYGEQAASDHDVIAISPNANKFERILKEEKPDVIYSFGHGFENGAYIGKQKLKTKKLKRIFKNAKLKSGTKIILHHCTCAGNGNVLDKLAKAFPSLEFYGNTTLGDGVRNINKRDVSNNISLNEFLNLKIQDLYGLTKKRANSFRKKVLNQRKQGSKQDSGVKSGSHILFRELPLIGFEDFWKMLTSQSISIGHLGLTSDAENRLFEGIGLMQERFDEVSLLFRSEIAAGN